MIAKRIIPCLDCDLSVPEGRVVKGVEFKQIKYAGIPWERAELYYKQGADEIVFLDITASSEKRHTMTEVVKKTAEKVFVPITVGGGIKSLADAKAVFEAGADKVSLNTAAIKNPKLITEISESYGRQAVVLAIDAKRRLEGIEGKNVVKTKQGDCWFECSIYGGREFTGIDAIDWAKKAVELGAGEILLTSMDRDGTKEGFDLGLTKKIGEETSVPVIASGGAGKLESIAEVLTKGKADAALAASIFHFNEFTVGEVKEYLKKKGINVRL
ncbi:MAG: imidazole glycerol phosphate synthase subunit HisF [Candidatus Diapherotrites archaeon]